MQTSKTPISYKNGYPVRLDPMRGPTFVKRKSLAQQPASVVQIPKAEHHVAAPARDRSEPRGRSIHIVFAIAVVLIVLLNCYNMVETVLRACANSTTNSTLADAA